MCVCCPIHPSLNPAVDSQVSCDDHCTRIDWSHELRMPTAGCRVSSPAVAALTSWVLRSSRPSPVASRQSMASFYCDDRRRLHRAEPRRRTRVLMSTGPCSTGPTGRAHDSAASPIPGFSALAGPLRVIAAARLAGSVNACAGSDLGGLPATRDAACQVCRSVGRGRYGRVETRQGGRSEP